MTPERKAEVAKAVDMYQHGKSTWDIAAELFYSRATIANWLRQEGVLRRLKKITPKMSKGLFADYNNGMRTVDIAKKYHVSVASVNLHVRNQRQEALKKEKRDFNG